jgi:outer membrane protein W
MFSIRITTVTALAIAVAAVAAIPVASAKGGDRVRVAGVCTQSSSAKLKLSREDRRIEVEFEVDQNRNGVPWKVTLRRNGALVASTTATTHAPSGSFSVRRLIARVLTTDHITAVATRASGERCTARGAF